MWCAKGSTFVSNAAFDRGLLPVLAQGSALAPFIYTIF